MNINIIRLPEHEGLELPKYQTKESAGFDLQAAIYEPVVIEPGQIKMIDTGLQFGLPPGYEGQIRPRSGLACKKGITLANCVGTLDSDYRGDVMVALINLGQEPFTVERGMRIAQMIIAPVIQVSFNVVDTLDKTERGSNGFGSTGVK